MTVRLTPDFRHRLPKRLATLYLVVLTYLLLAPHPLWVLGSAGQKLEQTVTRTFSDDVQHAGTYAVLVIMLMWAFTRGRGVTQSQAIGFAFLHGVSMEGLQHFIPHRYCDWKDILANAVGVACGWAMASLIVIMRPADAADTPHELEEATSLNSPN